MKHLYRLTRAHCLLLLSLLALSLPGRAQSGPYGNEWIVPSQAYYKIKITKDGIYRLDQAYLTQAGLSASTNPQRVQLWRRGREVAMYGGGNQSQLDATTYFEFYGQRNDGALDRGMYKDAADQPHKLYSLFTDTAAYFLTVSTTTNGRRMVENTTAATGTVHPSWLNPRLKMFTGDYNFGQTDSGPHFLSWADKGEGFLSGDLEGNPANVVMDSLFRPARTGAQAWLETLLVGADLGTHNTNISVLPGNNGTPRLLTPTPISYAPYQVRRVVLRLQSSDFTGNGQLGVRLERALPVNNDKYRLGYVRVVSPQVAHWRSGQRAVHFWNDSTLAGAAYYQLDSIPATVVGYDVTDPANVRRTVGAALGGQSRAYGFPGTVATTRHLLLTDASRSLTPAAAQRVGFRTSLNPSQPNFIIVTGRALMKPVGGVNIVRQYAGYRATAGTGRIAYDTLVVTSEMLYDQFHYGERSPLAVRQFARYMQTGSRTGQYLLLLGKGVFVSERGNGMNYMYRQAPANERDLYPDLVPVSTRGQSDVFFTSDWQNGDYVPRMITGRIPARTPAQVLAYLNKLRAHEAATPAAWRKELLHMSGGKSVTEQQQLVSYLASYESMARKPFFGANVTTIVNTALGPSTAPIVPQVNAGLALITYFGHGSNETIDLLPPPINQASSGYAQNGKYPVFIAAGCAIGRSASAGGSLGEDWVLADGKGSIGWMAESDLDIAENQHIYLTQVYKMLFNESAWYGKPLAAIQAEALRRIQTSSDPNINYILTTLYGQAMMTNITWHGDPAVSLFSPALPDYQFTPGVAPVAIESTTGSGPVLSSAPSFRLRLRLSNYGKIEPVRSINITIGRTVTAPGSTGTPRTITHPPVTIPYFLRDTTVVVTLTNPSSAAVFGNNTFTVRLDDPNVIPELSETNNTATFTHNFLNGGITLLQPTPFAIVGRANARLVVQSNIPQATPLRYEFQLDTIPTFTSPVNRTSFTALDVATWTPNLPNVPGRDSVVFYWRVRFDPRTVPAGLDTTWMRSSFRFINGSPGGWSQSHYAQMASNATQQITQRTPGGQWEFDPITKTLELKTVGLNTTDLSASNFPTTYGFKLDGQLVPVGNCGQTGLNPNNSTTLSPHDIIAMVIDPVSLNVINNVPGGNWKKCGDIAGGRTLFFFSTTVNLRDSLNADNINTAYRQAQLLNFLRNVPNGAYVSLVSVNHVKYTSFLPALKAQLTSMGSSLINTAQDGDPLAMLLRKGFPAQAQEVTFSPTDPTPRNEQIITLNATLTGRNTSGTITSTRIGPALQWQTLHYTLKRPDGPADEYTLRLVGYDANNQRTVLNPSVTGTNSGSTTSYSLSGVDARQYPYLALELELRDVVTRTPPQLKQWLVTYRGLPEGTVRRDHPAIPANAYAATTLSAAAASTGVLDIPVFFENVSDVDFTGRTRAKAYVTQVSGGRQDTMTVWATRAAGFSQLPRADSVARYNFRLNVAALSGEVNVRIVANSDKLPEQTDINNELNLVLTAPTITLPPVLDVAFDGQHILNGDIVSTNPEILVDVKYEDKRRPLTDPNKVDLFLTWPDGRVERVNMTNTQLIRTESQPTAGRFKVYFLPAELTAAKKLPDGVYKLEVQAKDMADNPAASQLYAVSFEVISAATITNVFPYPNPVTSRTRFVFTLTGTTPPRNMKIQILTISGKVVKEIMQSELGNVRVGNNISEYAWDGTDTYGDQLANGTYLYRVVLDDPGSEYTHRRTAADAAFKKGWGKLVLLR
ncbi:C25 family cysteine peptidase [Hymenobacter gummosus]|nr:C25 family cysteine peptidase [Hymenobacter gummosus]